jgi:hypothetical protein
MDNQLLFIVIIILILFFMFNSSTKHVKKQHKHLPMDPYNPQQLGHKVDYVVKHGNSYQVVSVNEPILQAFSPPSSPIKNYSY